ncbi:ribonuclease P protein subunit p29 [Danaus plexippus]|uniref:ribonuclease P protein subunit p29 n=1 Tax=Danaus plexippus TaxID=13037 RepID=UPI002AAF6DCD|nr:ribonuclease P protein subunit p29 [Danaus plexippus]
MSSPELDEASQSVIDFLNANVRKKDENNITNELKKDFLLAKKKSKEKKRKPNKKKSRILGRRERKKLGFYTIQRNTMKYNEMTPLNKVWCEYMSQLLELDQPVPDYNSKNWEQFSQTLHKADFHGSYIQVVRSKCPSYVGKKGICIMDTRNTFKILSSDNILTTIPKKDSIFEFCVNDIKIMILGKHLCMKPADRSAKRIKSYLEPDLP